MAEKVYIKYFKGRIDSPFAWSWHERGGGHIHVYLCRHLSLANSFEELISSLVNTDIHELIHINSPMEERAVITATQSLMESDLI